MSLINDMLKDLDARRAAPNGSETIALQGLGLAVEPRTGQLSRTLVITALIVALAGTVLALWSWRQPVTAATPGPAHPTPILVFTRDSQSESIDLAVKAGATAYVVDCNEPERLPTLLGVAMARFDEQQRLTKELLQTKNALQERKSVEKAKGIIMKSKHLSEDQAYNAMRKLAMNSNKRMGEIAEQIISASEVLV